MTSDHGIQHIRFDGEPLLDKITDLGIPEKSIHSRYILARDSCQACLLKNNMDTADGFLLSEYGVEDLKEDFSNNVFDVFMAKAYKCFQPNECHAHGGVSIEEMFVPLVMFRLDAFKKFLDTNAGSS